MTTRLFRVSSNTSNDERLPFANNAVEDADFESTDYATDGPSVASTSYHQRTPARSFFHHAHQNSLDPQYSSQGVREKTQELAGYALLDHDEYPNKPRAYTDSAVASTARDWNDPHSSMSEAIIEEEVPELDLADTATVPNKGPVSHRRHKSIDSRFSRMNRSLRADSSASHSRQRRESAEQAAIPIVNVIDTDEHQEEATEAAALLGGDLERGQVNNKRQYGTALGESALSDSREEDRVTKVGRLIRSRFVQATDAVKSATVPKQCTKEIVMEKGVASTRTLSAVFLGLLLNILDGLSYGMILFPLGEKIFADTGPDGISIFFVSTIISQLVYSGGFSGFKGGVGSEMIEVVPFFHKMAYMIMAHMGDADDHSILATVIVCYPLSAIITGLIFFILGAFRLGNLVSFFPRSILTGCIGGVGFFLFITGVEVSARLNGNLEYNYDTLHKLFQLDTVFLWTLPLFLAIFIIVLRHFYKSPLILPAFFIFITAVFYLIAKAIMRLDLDYLRNQGWIFDKPASGVPFYRFYSYFDFKAVDWEAVSKTIPTMFALSFFGIIHVPINVPALGQAVQVDDIDINRELIAHGVSNAVSGCLGSIQNYLVYANSYLFINNGGDSRLSGLLLAAATTAVWIAGPGMIGFIPVNIVGTLIFMLGIELLWEAVWEPFGKLHKLEYITIIVIVLIMGVYDFVVGIVAGIVLACLNYVVQTSRTPAISAAFNGTIATSTVRRPRLDRLYLEQVRSQIWVEKLSGFLFFGTIVAVEKAIKELVDDEFFNSRLIRYVIVDLSRVSGIDFSAADAFLRMNRVLCRRNVQMILSGVSFSDDVGRSLNMVGLFDLDPDDVGCPSPEIYEDLNGALEACENDLLEPFYKHRVAIAQQKEKATPMSIRGKKSNSTTESGRANSFSSAMHSPRRSVLFQAAATTLRDQGGGPSVTTENNAVIPSKWKNFAQPVKIMLQTFEGVSTQTEDFWHRAAAFFQRRELSAGDILYSCGDEPNGFYLLESGRVRAEYILEQGNYHEVILPGTTCGELPFFSDTYRTGTVAAEQDCIAWLLTREKWQEMEREKPEIATEMLKIGLKLTSERMNAITSYVLVTAS